MSISIGVFQMVADKRADPAVVAKAAEDLGFNSYWVPEHPILPAASKSTYTADAADEDPELPDYLWQIPDPFVALARASATTSNIRLGCGVCLVPQHHPLILANEVASLDHFSDGRLNFGIGAGWNREEAEMLGVDFDHRWSQTKECVAILKELWSKEIAQWEGEYYSFSPVRCFPKPAQTPHPPIHFGSSGTPRVFKRIAEWGDGWMPTIRTLEEFAEGCERLRRACDKVGRNFDDIHVSPLVLEGLFRTKGERDAFAAAGADEMIMWITETETAQVMQELEEFADELIET
tara:strand:+ start:121 stop:996 length:876 start_codon:yes stop_codon:yes gene_type:complete